MRTFKGKYFGPFMFCFGLLCMFTFFVVTAFASAGPLVLGSELNTNGLVEYLCLGTDCDRLWTAY